MSEEIKNYETEKTKFELSHFKILSPLLLSLLRSEKADH